MRNENLNLELLDEEPIMHKFGKEIKALYTVGMDPIIYIESLVKYLLAEKTNYIMARKAYVSSLRAYARLQDRETFKVKKLNLKLLAKAFGLSNVKAADDTSNK